jgi:transcriptional regulator with XRE-family HTH domain
MALQNRFAGRDFSPEKTSKRIKETREARGMTASEFARLVGVTPTAVWNWEKNSITPRRPALEQIAKVLGVSTDFLLGGTSGNGVAEPPNAPDSMTAIVEDARARLAQATGWTLDRIKLNVEFTTE